MLLETCRRTLTAARLDALPPALRARTELVALRHAVALSDGQTGAPGRQAYLTALAWNLARLTRLEAVLAAARADGLKLVPLKGAVLVRTHYGDPGARPMLDLDVACAPGDLGRAVALCQDLGFTRSDPQPFRYARDAVHDVKMSTGHVQIELHHRLWHELRIARDVEPLMARATEIAYGATTAWVPAIADHLYVVMVHAATHGFTGNALWMTDAALLAGGGDGASSLWAEVEALAAASGARVALAAARDHLRATMPWMEGGGEDVARMRRAILKRMAPWLQRGEGKLGPWASRIVRPLLFDRTRDLGDWALEKLSMWGKEKR